MLNLRIHNNLLGVESKQPLISIITVVLNGVRTLEEAIKSVVRQKFQNYEYIIVDGGSTDGSIEIIKKYESILTFWISEHDEGVYYAMNKAVALTRGRWVYFLGADDQLFDSFEEVAYYLKNEKTIYYGNVYRPVIDRTYDGEFSAYKLACRNICHQSIFYPRSIWDRYSYNLEYSVFADYDLNLRCFADPNLKFQYIPVTIAIFTDHGGLSPTQRDVAFEKDKLSIIKAAFPFSVYFFILIRFYIISFLNCLKLHGLAIKIYRYLQKLKFGRSKDFQSIN